MKKTVLIVEDQFVEANYLRSMLEKAGYTVTGIARSVAKAKEMIGQEKPALVLLDIFLSGKQTGIDLAIELKQDNIAFVYLSANSNEEVLTAAKATQPYGFLVKPFREKDLLITLEIAEYRHEHGLESRLKRESVLQSQLSGIIADSLTWDQKLLKIGMALQPYIPFDLIAAGFNTAGDIPCHALGYLRTGYDEYQAIGINELMTITNLKMAEIIELAALTKTNAAAIFYNEEKFEDICRERSLKKLFANNFQLRSHLSLPLKLSTKKPFSFCLYSRRPDTYNREHIALFERLQQLLNESIATMLESGNEDARSDNNLAKQGDAISNPNSVPGFEGIIGKSSLLLNVFDHIVQVAPTDTSVLILGESGTGKERIADCIHDLSPRRVERLVKINCAALHPSLIESELFGHEKGSFTGATEKRIGKFEQADKGTIFLDEIGDMPFELQVKLLRVLQEKEIERIGSKLPVKINIRIIAATNKNLEKEVAEGRFRLDLYYRLNTFPVELPALRDRKEDIPILITHFINHYNRKAGKKITGISDKDLANLVSYDWPGNIRELEHIIERAILLAKCPILENIPLPVKKMNPAIGEPGEVVIKSIDENERDHILSILKLSNGRIWGPGGAAELLNLPPTTLSSKMKKLGIKKEYIE